MKKDFITKVIEEGDIDTEHYRYIARSGLGETVVSRLPLCYLDTPEAVSHWETVAVINENSPSEQIKAMRREMGMSQKAFGEFIGGAAIRTIQDWERGLRVPPEYVISLIKFKIDTVIKNSGE